MDAEELTDEQIAELEERLVTLREELTRLLDSTREGTKPVDLSEPIGRLTRMDAMQQQSMSSANRRSHEVRLQQVQAALAAIDRDEYGLCRRCEEPIGYKRLDARPESPFCIACQDAIDRKHG